MFQEERAHLKQEAELRSKHAEFAFRQIVDALAVKPHFARIGLE